MANLTSTTITGTLDTTSTITGPGAGVSALNASNVSSGTLSNDRLDTVPTTKGGTGLTSIGSAGQVLTVAAPGSTLEFADAGGGGGLNIQVFTSPGTYTPTAGMKNIKVTVLGGGGGGNGAQDGQSGSQDGSTGGGGGLAFEELTAAQVGASQPVTVGPGGSGGNNGEQSFNPGNPGGTSSFGAFVSATGGSNGNPGSGGGGGSGSGGNLNLIGQPGAPTTGGLAAQAFGFGGNAGDGNALTNGNPGTGKGGGAGRTPRSNTTTQPPMAAASGAAGVVIIEEYL